MKCPNCGVACAKGASECGACGLLFSKWLERREREKREKREAAAALAQLEVKSQAVWNPWIGRSIAFAMTVIWCALFAWYVHRETLRARGRALESKENEDTVEFRDPKTGDMKTLRLPKTSAQ